MKKLLIISYFFPPGNFAGSYRIAAWAKYFHKFGYYPVIITRCWNENQSNVTDHLHDNKFSHEVYDTHEVYRLPYTPNLRDRLHDRYGDSRFRLFRKLLTFIEIFFQHYTDRVIPYANLYDFAKKLLKENNDFHFLILSGRPFQLFKFGYQLHRDTGIKWIADYRDEWNSHQWISGLTFSDKVIKILESRSEKKWLSSASIFTSVSENWVSNISAYVHRPGKIILNGYEDNVLPDASHKPSTDTFTILHNGTLYPPQEIEIFLAGFKKFIDQNPNAKVKLLFPGIDYIEDQGQRVRGQLVGYEAYFSASHRIPKQQLTEMMANASILLMIGTRGMKGHHSSKIFEYIASGKPVLLCPDDKDVMAELIHETRSGVVLGSSDEVLSFLNKSYQQFLNGIPLLSGVDRAKVAFYSREKQTALFAGILDELIAKK